MDDNEAQGKAPHPRRGVHTSIPSGSNDKHSKAPGKVSLPAIYLCFTESYGAWARLRRNCSHSSRAWAAAPCTAPKTKMPPGHWAGRHPGPAAAGAAAGDQLSAATAAA
ncbi:hypothetical protein PCLA_07r0168 [Pseudomonas citronellolis]|nr:hypothetical protein PCLA_07r0168 [Pseudomonas citronellolis]